MLDPRDNDMLLEAYLDDELSIEEKQDFELRLVQEPELAGQLALARRIQTCLRGLPLQACPPETVRRVMERVEKPSRWQKWRRALADLAAPSPHPAWLGMALGLALTVALIRPWDGIGSLPGSADLRPPTAKIGAVASESPPTAQEVAAAEEELKLALAYLGKLGRTAGSSVRRLTSDNMSTERGELP